MKVIFAILLLAPCVMIAQAPPDSASSPAIASETASPSSETIRPELTVERTSEGHQDLWDYNWSIKLTGNQIFLLSLSSIKIDETRRFSQRQMFIHASDAGALTKAFEKFLEWEKIAATTDAEVFAKPLAKVGDEDCLFSWMQLRDGQKIATMSHAFVHADVVSFLALLQKLPEMQAEQEKQKEKAKKEAALFN